MDKPISFSAPMARALLDGRKTMTRRIPSANFAAALDAAGDRIVKRYPHQRGSGYEVGMRLWVREQHALVPVTAYRASDGVQQTINPTDTYEAAIYRQGWDRSGSQRWRPSIHMPRWASRLTLTVTDVRVQRLQEISEEDARAEGVRQVAGFFQADKPDGKTAGATSAVAAFALLWNSLHGPEAWQANPWVVVLRFSVAARNIDAQEAPNG